MRRSPGHSVVVVGGGSAGCILAARLSEDPGCSVLLLEAGRDVRSVADLPEILPPRYSASRSLSDSRMVTGAHEWRRAPRYDPGDLWSYDVSLLDGENRPATQYRGRVLGGSSAVNGALFMRGVPADYDAWGDLWRFDRVLPYFRKLERDADFHDQYHGDAGPFDVARHMATPVGPFQQRFRERARALGVRDKPDLNHPDGDGIGCMPISNQARSSTSTVYLSPARKRPNLTVRTGVVVRRVAFERDRAIGVECLEDGKLVVEYGDQIILCAGTFELPQLLMHSGIGPADHLRGLGLRVVCDLPGVGQNLSCHPIIVVRGDTDQASDDPSAPRIALVYSSTSGTSDEHNDTTMFPRVIGGEGTVLVSLRYPVSSGSLRLTGSDPDGKPHIHYGYLDGHDLDRLRDALQFCFEVLGRAPEGEVSKSWILVAIADRRPRVRDVSPWVAGRSDDSR